jgi:hypothetical protein
MTMLPLLQRTLRCCSARFTTAAAPHAPLLLQRTLHYYQQQAVKQAGSKQQAAEEAPSLQFSHLDSDLSALSDQRFQ